MLNHNQYGFSSKNLCVRPRTGPRTRGGTPLDGFRGQQPDDGRPSAEKQAMMDNMKATDKVEQQVRDALFARSTAHKGEERILRAAFSKFDKDHLPPWTLTNSQRRWNIWGCTQRARGWRVTVG